MSKMPPREQQEEVVYLTCVQSPSYSIRNYCIDDRPWFLE